MFGMSWEHLIILAIILIIVGPRRLPDVGNNLGKMVRNFKDSMSGVEEAAFRKLDDAKPLDSEKTSAQTEASQQETPPKNDTTGSGTQT